MATVGSSSAAASSEPPPTHPRATTKGIKHQVSDLLSDRHPYDPSKGPAAQRSRDAGLVFNGMLPHSIDALLDSAADQTLSGDQRLAALGHLYAFSAAAERKVEFVRKGLVPTLAGAMQAREAPKVEAACARLLRSLAVLPQTAHAVIQEGGAHACVLTIMDRSALKEREEARVAAAWAVCQIASSWCGRNWLLGIPVDDGMQLDAQGSPAQLAPAVRQEQLSLLLAALVSVLEKDRGNRKLLRHTLTALAALSAVDEGLRACLDAGALSAVGGVLEMLAADDAWMYADSAADGECALQAATVVWHVGLSDTGREGAVPAPLVPALAKIAKGLAKTKERLIEVKGAVAGACGALMLQPSLKRLAIEGDVRLADAVLDLLREANALFVPLHRARKAGQPSPTPDLSIDAVLAVMKNCVQAVRLIAELPDGRAALGELTSPAEHELRRQLFAGTAFQEEFEVWVY